MWQKFLENIEFTVLSNCLSVFQQTVSPNSVEIPKFIQFFDDHIKDKMEPFRTEWRIAAPDVSVAGSVDFVGRFPDGTYALIDWKRSKDLAAGLNNRFGKRAS